MKKERNWNGARQYILGERKEGRKEVRGGEQRQQYGSDQESSRSSDRV